ncbi:MAG: hypothetical protein ABL894_08180 [Hyphomicrobium sp.]
MDINQVSAAFSSLQALRDLAGAATNVRDNAAFLSKSNELHGQIAGLLGEIVAAQQRAAVQNAEIETLKSKLAELENWEKEKARYELVDFGGQTFALRLKANALNGEPTHRLCPDCFQQKRKSILQHLFNSDFGQEHVNCGICKRGLALGAPVRQSTQMRSGSWMSD